jgi:uncharacterized protein YbjT (DUF2867 family)
MHVIVIIGSRSKIGSALTQRLVEQGAAVRVLARTGEAVVDGVETVTGDLADRQSLDQAFKGADRVFLLSSPAPDDVTWHSNAVDAARAADVRHLVRSSVLGADSGSAARMARQHGVNDEYLAASGLPYTILRPNYFQQNVTEIIAPSVGADGAFYSSVGDARISMVDTDDVAAVAATVLLDPERHAGRTYELTGPQALSYDDVATTLAASFGRPVSYVDVPADASRQAMLGFGMDPWTVEAVVELYDSYRQSGRDGFAVAVTDTVQQLTGRAPSTLENLLAKSGP